MIQQCETVCRYLQTHLWMLILKTTRLSSISLNTIQEPSIQFGAWCTAILRFFTGLLWLGCAISTSTILPFTRTTPLGSSRLGIGRSAKPHEVHEPKQPSGIASPWCNFAGRKGLCITSSTCSRRIVPEYTRTSHVTRRINRSVQVTIPQNFKPISLQNKLTANSCYIR